MTKEKTLTIDSYSDKGHGQNADSGALEVLDGIKGDKLLVERRHKKPIAIIKEILQASSARVQPKCTHAYECGGCVWQSMNYEQQLEEKQRIVQALFPEHPVSPILGCKEPWQYRNKMEFSFSEDAKGEKYLGLYKKGERNKVLSITECHITQPWCAEMLARIRTWWHETDVSAYHPPTDSGVLRSVTLRSGDNKMVILTVSGNAHYALTRTQIRSFIQAAAYDAETSVYLLIQCAKKGTKTAFYEMHLAGPDHLKVSVQLNDTQSVTLELGPQTFLQPNLSMMRSMYQKMIDLAQLQGDERVLDLYCGMGSIGMAFSPHVKEIIGVEQVSSSIVDGKANLERLDIQNVQLYCLDAKEFIQEQQYFPPFDLVIVDPPRGGVEEKVLDYLITLKPKKILYLSCNPKTQREDLVNLLNYKVKAIHPFDQFPHTRHIENLVYLVRRESP